MKFSDQLEARFAKFQERYPVKRSALVPMLMYAQDETGALTPEVIAEIASRLDLTVLQVNEVIGYYSMKHRKPLGKYHVQVCTNISCMLTGAYKVWDRAKKTLGLNHKERSADGLFSLEEVECMGACSWAPAVQVNYDFHHFVTPEEIDKIVADLKNGN